jgi:hypothetical protein
VVLVDITGYVEHLRADLAAAAATGGEAMVDAADRLATALDAAVRMALLEALSDAAAEITAALEGTTVEVRMRGREPDLVVTVEAPAEPPTPAFAPPGPPPPGGLDGDDADEGAIARITLRLPEPLKQRAEAAAGATRQSLNTWLVEAVRSAVDGEHRPSGRSGRRGPQHLTGWVR